MQAENSQSSLHGVATMRERALVLGGGGASGNAWLIGVIAGLFDAGLNVTEPDLIIGTSAGATAAAQISSASTTELLAAVLTSAPQARRGRALKKMHEFPSGRAQTIWRKLTELSVLPQTRRICAAK